MSRWKVIFRWEDGDEIEMQLTAPTLLAAVEQASQALSNHKRSVLHELDVRRMS